VSGEAETRRERIFSFVLAQSPRPLVVGLQLSDAHEVVGPLFFKANGLHPFGRLLVEEVRLQAHSLVNACRGLLAVVVETSCQVESLHRFAVMHSKNIIDYLFLLCLGKNQKQPSFTITTSIQDYGLINS